MPDIRDVLKALNDDDRRLYSQVRTEMRRSYISAHAATLNTTQWIAEDDAFLDLIDIQVGMLFVRADKFDFKEGHLDIDEAGQIEKEIKERMEKLSLIKKGNSSSVAQAELEKHNVGSWTPRQ